MAGNNGYDVTEEVEQMVQEQAGVTIHLRDLQPDKGLVTRLPRTGQSILHKMHGASVDIDELSKNAGYRNEMQAKLYSAAINWVRSKPGLPPIVLEMLKTEINAITAVHPGAHELSLQHTLTENSYSIRTTGNNNAKPKNQRTPLPS